MGENEYMELFGLNEPEQNAGAAETPDEQEPTEPAQERDAETAETAEAAEPEEADAGGAEEPDENEKSNTEEPAEPEKRGNAQAAAARRHAAAEKKAAVERARAEERQRAQAEMDAAIASMGLTNPYNGNTPIRTKAEYDAYRARHDAACREEVQRKTGLTDEEFARFTETLPEVQAARQARAQAETLLRQTQRERVDAGIRQELDKITALNPAVRELSDLESDPAKDTILAYVKDGYKLSDAWKLAHYEDITNERAQAQAQATARAAAGKAHLGATKQRGRGSVPVPREVRDYYRALNPGATDDEISRDYNRYMQNK